MTNVATIKKEVEEIKKIVDPHDICLGWLSKDGTVNGVPKDKFVAQKEAEGYAEIVLLRWRNPHEVAT